MAEAGVAPLEIVVTGGKGGLGRALAAQFAAAGHHVRAPGREELDVRDEAAVQAYFTALPRLDVVIANAGLTRDGTLPKLTETDFDLVADTNLKGAFLCARAALKPMLLQRSGHIILIGSRAARAGTHGQSLYAAAKAGLIGFGQSLAREYGPRNIRCNIVLPGFMETKMTASLPPARIEVVRAEHALGRFNTPENAARFIAFLSELDHVSGQVFTLDSRLDRWT